MEPWRNLRLFIFIIGRRCLYATYEHHMINLAMKLVEKRLLEGTASSAETTHFLKLATSKNELEKTKLEEENKLLRAKTETLQNAKHSEELYEKAIAAMKKYNGLGEDDEYEC